MQLKKLQLNNFQSHRNTVLEFSEGLNCITGSSHVGKSALVRGLKFLLFNEFDKKYVTWGEDICSVKALFDNGIELTRERNGSINRYVLKKDKVEDVFENFGTDVPKKIIDVLQIYKAQFDADKFVNLNIMEQHDNFFLLNESDTFRAKAIGSLIGLHYVDSATRSLLADIKENKALKVSLEKNIEDRKKNLDCFKEICNYEQVYQVSIDLLKKIKDLNENLKKLEVVQQDIVNFQQKQKSFDLSVERYKNFDENKAERLFDILKEADKLESLIYEIISFERKATDFKERSETYQNFDSSKSDSFFSLLDKIKIIENLHNEILNFIKKKESWQKSFDEKEAVLNHYKENYRQALIKEHVCPVCLSKIDENKIDTLMKEV